MALEDMMADAFNRILSGDRINERMEAWNVSNLNTPWNIDITYGTSAIYGFTITRRDDYIEFANYHREASKGTGTRSLKQLEEAFKVLADMHETPVTVLFNPFGQEDTIAWLQKNNYAVKENGTYAKTFKPLQPIYGFYLGKRFLEATNPERTLWEEISMGDIVELGSEKYVIFGAGGGIKDCPEGFYRDDYSLMPMTEFMSMVAKSREPQALRITCSTPTRSKMFELVKTGKISEVTSKETYELRPIEHKGDLLLMMPCS